MVLPRALGEAGEVNVSQGELYGKTRQTYVQRLPYLSSKQASRKGPDEGLQRLQTQKGESMKQEKFEVDDDDIFSGTRRGVRVSPNGNTVEHMDMLSKKWHNSKVQTFRVEGAKPIPEKLVRVYPWAEMEVGQCFTVPVKDKDERRKIARQVFDAQSKWTKKNGGKFIVRQIELDSGLAVRCWRTA